MKYIIHICIVAILFIACNPNKESEKEQTVYSKFSGNYNKTFNDLHDLHMDAALKKGITPLTSRADTSHYMKELVRIPTELELYKTDKLTHSIPYLVKDASELFIDICTDFRDSLISKKIPLHKLILTSITRTNEDVENLTKKNMNASENSVHRYGTTFDISWKRFDKLSTTTEEVSSEKLKFVLAEVLNNMKQENRCYIKHERKQACFHITVR